METIPEKIAGDVKVTAYRDAAHRYCQMVGQNPGDEVPTPHPTIVGVAVMKPKWYIIAEQMLDLSRLLRAMAQAEKAKAANDPQQKH